VSGNDAIRIAGTVTETLPKGRFRVQLANGHRLVARVLRKDADEFGGIRSGDELRLRVCPGDMSQGIVDEILKTKPE
jgi:translation initiation factor IF-1